MFEQTFKNIDDVLWKEAGCATELDYTEQTSRMLFLKYLDDLEKANEQRALLEGKTYQAIIDKGHRWSVWAAPKKKDGTFDHDKARTGDDLIDYVNKDLFPYLQGFRTRAEGPDTIEYKIGEIFGEIKNRFQSGYSLRDALELIDQLRFNTQAEKHELSELYEGKLRNMGNAGRNGGEYYTPRPLTDNAAVALRKQLLEDCNLHTVLDMPGGTFQGAGVKTVVLFFEKGAPTRKTWFYKLDPGRNLGKTNPLNDDDLKDFVALQAKFKDSENSWSVDAKGIDKATLDLSVKNPNKADKVELRDPKDIIAEMTALDAESAAILKKIEATL